MKSKKAKKVANERPFIQRFKAISAKYIAELCIVAFCFVLYGNTIFNGYNLDDEIVTIHHPLTSAGVSAIPEIFRSPYYRDNQGYAYDYRPVVLASFAIEHQFLGESPHTSHFINILLYALACIILYRVLKAIFGDYPDIFRLAVLLVFVAFPTHTEVVASIKNRDEILSFIFGVSTLWLANYVLADPRRKWVLIFLPILFSLSLMSKFTSVFLVILIPILLILTSRISFRSVVFIVALLLLPTFPLMDISDLSSKIAIIAAFFSSVILFYIFFHASDIYRMSISRISDIRMSLFSDSTKTNLNQRGADSDTFWNSIIPPAYYLGWAPILYTCFISLLCIAGVHYMSCLFLGMALLTIFIFMYIGNTVMKWWSNVLFMVITVGIEFIYPVPLGKTIYGDLLSLILLHHIFYGYRKLFIPSLLCFVAHGTLNVFCFSNMNIFSYVSFFFLLRWRYGLWPVPLILIGGAWALYGYLTGGYYVPGTLLHTEYLGFVWVGFYVLVSLIMKQERLLLGAFKFIAVATIVLFMRSGITPISIQPIPVSQIKQSINNFGNTTKTNVLPGNTFRPLTYIEEPLGPSSSPNIRIGTSLVVLMHYLRKVVVPYPLSFYYGYKFIEPVNFTTSLLAQASLVLYILILIAALYYSKRNKLLSAGLFIYLISIAVFSNYYYPVAGIVGDRYLFYPSLGFALFLCTVLFRFPYIDPAIPYTSWRLLPRIILYPFIGLICLYSVLTFMRNFDWKDKLTLYSHDIKYVSASAQAHNLLALEYAHKGSTSTDISELHQNFELAADQFARSIAIYPSFFNTNYDLGRCLLSLGKPDSALYWFKKSILINTEFPDVYGQIGNIYLTNKQYDSAARYYNMTLALAPTQLSLYQGLLNIYTSQNNKDSAYSVFDRAIHYLPDSQAIYKGAIEYSLYLKDQPNAVRYARQSLSRFNDEYARGVINNVGAK